MDFHILDTLRQKHPGWRLLAADHAPLIASFLHDTFVRPNVRTLPQPDLASRLDDYLYALRLELGEIAFPRQALDYLENWASDEHAWLRKYYPPSSDIPHFDITPATEKALDWIVSLSQRQFVGTESRLMMVFELLHQLVEGTEKDPWARIGELERRRSEIDSEIDRIRKGHPYVLDETRIKERFVQLSTTARGLLSDFREVEQNFRDLDRRVRERIATFEGGKGILLEEIFGDRDAIVDSDQGKSFRAFWDFLMSPARQEELTDLLAKVFDLDPVKELQPDRRILRIHYDWLEAGEVAQRTVAKLSEQLRRYLDDKAWQENRRIMQLIREVEQTALSMRDSPPDRPITELDETAPDIDLTMDRPMFEPPLKSKIDDVALTGDEDVPYDALFNSVYVDKDRLAANIRQALQSRSQISLDELVQSHPLRQGLAELVTYFSLAAEDGDAIIDDTQRKMLTWTDQDDHSRQATLPLVIFCRPTPCIPGRIRDMATAPNALSLVLIGLMKGVMERDSDEARWQSILDLQTRIRDHVAVLGLELILDEAEGYAYLRQRPAREGEEELPRLVPRRQLGYQVSLLLALLRKKLAEFDAISGESRLILSRDDIVDMLRLFTPDTSNQARLMDRMDAHINRITEMGFLRRLRGTDNQYEVRRILKAFIDAQWLSEFHQRLSGYCEHASGDANVLSTNE